MSIQRKSLPRLVTKYRSSHTRGCVQTFPFYSDPECTDRVPGAHILILRPLDPDGYDILEVVPSRKIYTPGQYLTWHLNNKKMWENCFYRNPITGEIEEAWSLHVEYAGRVLSDDTVAKYREKLNELEGKYPQDSEIKSI